MIIDPEIVKRHKVSKAFFSTPGQTNHRALVIQMVCELESNLCSVIAKFFATRNDTISEAQVMDDLYSENGMLGSLSRIAKIAFYLGFIDENVRHDLAKLAKIRNAYAHDMHRRQLGNEPDFIKLLNDTVLYRKNANQLSSLSEQDIFFCIQEHLIKVISEININA